jgi:hypothetical protein
MLNTYNLHNKYLSDCVFYIYWFILAMPHLNTEKSISKFMEEYFHKFVKKNSNLSERIYDDCRDIIMIILKPDFITETLNKFENEQDAFHYLAFITQYVRLSNKYRIITGDKNNYFELSNIQKLMNQMN